MNGKGAFRLVPPFDCEVEIRADHDCPGEVIYDGGEPTIILREYDERVLLHECIHVLCHRVPEIRRALGEQEERAVRELTRALYGMGWRWRKTDREVAQIERELSEVARQRDEIALLLDGEGAPARDFYAQEAEGV